MSWHTSLLRASRWALVLAGRSIKVITLVVVLVYAVVAIAILSLRYYVLPNIDQYRPKIEQVATKALGNTVRVGAVNASWLGLRPKLMLTNVELLDAQQRTALNIPQIDAVLDWKSLFFFEPRFYSLLIGGADLTIRRDVKGQLSIAGLKLPASQQSAVDQDSALIEWLTTQTEIAIRQAQIRWIDELRQAPELALNDLDFVLLNRGRETRFALHARGPAAAAPRIDLRGQFQHRFLSNVANPQNWSGTAFVDLAFVDLATWRAYFDYPVDVSRGQGAVRMWVDINQGTPTDLTTDVALQNVLMRTSKVAPVLGIAQAHGRATFTGLDSDSRMRAENLQMRLADGLELAPTALEHHITRGVNGRPDVTEVVADGVDIQSVAALLERLMPTATLRTVIAQSKASGRFETFKLRLVGEPSAPQSYEVTSKFSGLSLAAGALSAIRSSAQAAASTVAASSAIPASATHPHRHTAHEHSQSPGFHNISGVIRADEKSGSLELDTRNGSVTLPGVFDEPVIALTQAKGKLSWSLDPSKPQQTFALDIANLQLINPDFDGNLQGTYKSSPNSPGIVDFKGGLVRASAQNIHRYLPTVMRERVRLWLKYALREGTARDTQFVLKGNLFDFPYENNAGEFKVSTKVDGATLDYVPLIEDKKRSEASEWPVLTDIKGDLVFDRNSISLTSAQGKVYGTTLSDIQVNIPHLKQDVALEIQGNAQGDLSDFIRFVNTSPIGSLMGDLTAKSIAKGKSKLGLDLSIPLSDARNTKVKGTLEFLGNDLQIDSAWPALTRTQGKLEFTETGFALRNLSAQALGGTVKVDGAPQNGSATYRIDGSAQGSAIARWIGFTPQAANQVLTGNLNYKASYTLTKKLNTLSIESNLSGLGIELPAPLRKISSDAIPFKVEYSRPTLPVGATSKDYRDSMSLMYGRGINVRLDREADPSLKIEGKPLMKYVRGGVSVNESLVVPDSGIIVNLNMPAVDFDAWIAVADGIEGHRLDANEPSSTSRPNIAVLNSTTATNSAAPAPVTTNPSYSSAGLPLPEVIAARAQAVVIGGKRLNDVVLGASRSDRTWQASLNAQEVSGYVTWRMGNQGGLGAVEAKFAKLIIPKESAKEVNALIESQSTTTRLPQVDISADQFSLFGREFGSLELRARNIRAANEWRIEKLALTNPDATFGASGSWAQIAGQPAGKRRMNLKFNLDIANSGQLMNRLGFKDLMRAGTGKLDGTLGWSGAPYSLDYPSLSGKINIAMDQGQILKADAGAAKLLGVLTLQSLPRRLSLDFRDVFSEGFAFDTIRGGFDMNQGIATTQDLKLKGINATVVIGGKSDLAKEDIDFRFVVVPEVNLGTGSLIALATNPAVGIGTFVAQLLFREPLMKAFTFEYAATGKWSDPKFEKVGANQNKNNKNESAQPMMPGQ